MLTYVLPISSELRTVSNFRELQLYRDWFLTSREPIATLEKLLQPVRHRPEQNRVTWETPSSEAIPLLQEPIGVLASYATHAQRRYEANKCVTFISSGLAIVG